MSFEIYIERKIKMKEKMKKCIVLTVATFVIGGTLSANNVTKYFNFAFSYAVIGNSEFKLSKLSTHAVTTGQTYVYDRSNNHGTVNPNKANYNITLDGNGYFAADYTGAYKCANGDKCITNYGNVDKNTYTINVGTNSDATACGQYIRGNGYVWQ